MQMGGHSRLDSRTWRWWERSRQAADGRHGRPASLAGLSRMLVFAAKTCISLVFASCASLAGGDRPVPAAGGGALGGRPRYMSGEHGHRDMELNAGRRNNRATDAASLQLGSVRRSLCNPRSLGRIDLNKLQYLGSAMMPTGSWS